jgi:hypothetical protein
MSIIVGALNLRHAIIFCDSKQFRNARLDEEGNILQPAEPIVDLVNKTFKCPDFNIIGGVCDLLYVDGNTIMDHANSYLNENPNHCATLEILLAEYREILMSAINNTGLENREKFCQILIIGPKAITTGSLQLYKINITCNDDNIDSNHNLCCEPKRLAPFDFKYDHIGDGLAKNAVNTFLHRGAKHFNNEKEHDFFIRRANAAIHQGIKFCGNHIHCPQEATCSEPLFFAHF